MRSIAEPSPSLKSSESLKLYTRCSAAERGAGDNLLQPRRQPDVFSHVQAPASIALHGHHLNEQYGFKQNEFATKGRARPDHFTKKNGG